MSSTKSGVLEPSPRAKENVFQKRLGSSLAVQFGHILLHLLVQFLNLKFGT